jgi:hypothetical protein
MCRGAAVRTGHGLSKWWPTTRHYTRLAWMTTLALLIHDDRSIDADHTLGVFQGPLPAAATSQGRHAWPAFHQLIMHLKQHKITFCLVLC